MGIRKYLTDKKEKKQEELIRDEQYDDSSLTQGQKFKRWLRRDAQGLGIALSPIVAGALIYGAGWTYENVLNRQVTPLVWYDKNQDGVLDAVFAFPIKGTDRAIMRWADGRELAARGCVAPNSYNGFIKPLPAPSVDLSFLDTNALPFKIVDDYYSTTYAAIYTYKGKVSDTYKSAQYFKDYWNSEEGKYPLEEMLKKPEAKDERAAILIAKYHAPPNLLARLE